jgi:hypothetical protein
MVGACSASSRNSSGTERESPNATARDASYAADHYRDASRHPTPVPHSGCLRAIGLITVQLGPDQIVAMLSLEFADTMLAPDIEEVVIGLEKSLREANLEIVALFVKPKTAKTYQEQRDRVLMALISYQGKFSGLSSRLWLFDDGTGLFGA